ncbi:Atu4866 domain-containing protein [Spirosoma arcticum]
MRLINVSLMAALIGTSTLSTLNLSTAPMNQNPIVPTESAPQATQTNAYVGMWVTKDGHIRHELLPNGRYDEARGNRKSAYQGRYTLTGNHIDYVDDTGFTADGDFRDGVLYHAGMILFKEKS